MPILQLLWNMVHTVQEVRRADGWRLYDLRTRYPDAFGFSCTRACWQLLHTGCPPLPPPAPFPPSFLISCLSHAAPLAIFWRGGPRAEGAFPALADRIGNFNLPRTTGGPQWTVHSKIWSNSDCPALANVAGNLAHCKRQCLATPGCTAFNMANNDAGCSLRGCIAGKSPSWTLTSHKGHSLSTQTKEPGTTRYYVSDAPTPHRFKMSTSAQSSGWTDRFSFYAFPPGMYMYCFPLSGA